MPQSYLKQLNPSLLIDTALHGNVLDQCGAICELVNRKLSQREPCKASEMNALDSLSESTVSFWNSYTVGDFATAALHLLKNEDYTGNREEIQRLIAARLSFV